LLEVKNIKKVYNTKLGGKQCVALRDVSFSVGQGEFVAIMGASGSGKTTLLNLLASLDKPTEGLIYLDGKNFSDIGEKEISSFRRTNLGFVFQDFNLLDTFSIKDNILSPIGFVKHAAG
jgi:putative ABC transport system ATP-binding protein